MNWPVPCTNRPEDLSSSRAAIPRRDTKPLAKALLKKFGSFAEVIHASERFSGEVDGIKDASVDQLKLNAAAASRIAKGEIKRRVALS